MECKIKQNTISRLFVPRITEHGDVSTDWA